MNPKELAKNNKTFFLLWGVVVLVVLFIRIPFVSYLLGIAAGAFVWVAIPYALIKWIVVKVRKV